jgi:hypothetical protein
LAKCNILVEGQSGHWRLHAVRNLGANRWRIEIARRGNRLTIQRDMITTDEEDLVSGQIVATRERSNPRHI